MASASVAGKSKQSKSDPDRGDGPLATAPSDPNSSPAPLSRYESQKRRDWNTFLQYLRYQKPPITLAGCRDNHVTQFLRYLDQFGKTEVHLTGCPFYGILGPQGPCSCPLRQASGSLDALIGRLRLAYEEHGGRPESNPFGAKAVRDYLREVRERQAKARGIPYKKKKGKCPTTVTDKTVMASKGQGGNAAGTGTGSGGDGSGSAAQTTSTITTSNASQTTSTITTSNSAQTTSTITTSNSAQTTSTITMCNAAETTSTTNRNYPDFDTLFSNEEHEKEEKTEDEVASEPHGMNSILVA
ncbi:hypothetical protein SO802_000147 [Lithocarpus litseifolius]|uniref:ALOG domain-containing protein n=1 Tax=Lithocarpus litseifolius TaxID=425828 RepID=A0AAW2DU63_9ROSI